MMLKTQIDNAQQSPADALARKFGSHTNPNC